MKMFGIAAGFAAMMALGIFLTTGERYRGPKGALAWVSVAMGSRCPSGYWPAQPKDNGFVSGICVLPATIGTQSIVTEVRLNDIGEPCADGFEQTGEFHAIDGLQVLCTKSEPIEQVKRYVTGFYFSKEACEPDDFAAGKEAVGGNPLVCLRIRER